MVVIGIENRSHEDPEVRAAARAGARAGDARWPGCGGAPGGSDGKRTVVTSFYPLQYVTQRIAGRHADVVNLTHPGQEPHDLELTVRQTAQLVDADVVVYERGFQAAVDQAVDQSGPDARRRRRPIRSRGRRRPALLAGPDPAQRRRGRGREGARRDRPGAPGRLRPQPRRPAARPGRPGRGVREGPGELPDRHDRGQPRRVRLPRPPLRPRRGRHQRPLPGRRAVARRTSASCRT